jgi:tetratricopeptide (TPR) repeat protein/transcriptional regulator with XRE-family HTH domain
VIEAGHEFGVMLRQARRHGGLTQEELAHRSGLSTRTISDLECGRVARPRGSSLDLLLAALPADEATVAGLVAAARAGATLLVPLDVRTPAAALEPVVCELPAAAPDFTGRERELALLADLAATALDDGSKEPVVLILSGAPGIGKTALAVRLGHLLAARYPVMQLFVELGSGAGHPLAPADALRQLLGSLGVGDTQCPADQEQRVRRYRSLLYHRKALLLLDDAADEAQVRSLLPAGPGCVVVITSRHALAGLSPTCRVALDAWPSAEARTFLGQVAGQDRLAADPAAADHLLGLCGGLPLALRIAGNQLACRPGWSVAHLADRLQDERQRLALLSAGDLGVLPAFDLSYQQLSAQAQAVFRRLPLYPGTSFSADVLDTLAELDETSTSAFEELISASLIEAAAAPDRYLLHDLLRLYACGKREEDTPSQIREVEHRLTRWLLSRAAAAGGMLAPGADGSQAVAAFRGRPAAVAWLDAELPALLAAAARAAELGLAGEALTAADALSWYFDLQCQWHAWQTMCETLRPAAHSRGDLRAEACLLNSLGLALAEQRRLAEALELHEEAAGLARRAGDQTEEATALDFRAHVCAALGRYDEAVAGYEQALDLFRAAGYRRGEAMAINHCGNTLYRAGRHEESAGRHEQALVLFAALGDALGGAMARLNLALALAGLGKYGDAISHYRQALTTFEELQDRWGRARVLYGLGCALRADAGDAAAAECLRQASEAFRLIGDLAWERDVLRVLTSTLRSAGLPGQARTYEQRISDLDRALGS